jgi:hypothetical protein
LLTSASPALSAALSSPADAVRSLGHSTGSNRIGTGQKGGSESRRVSQKQHAPGEKPTEGIKADPSVLGGARAAIVTAVYICTTPNRTGQP